MKFVTATLIDRWTHVENKLDKQTGAYKALKCERFSFLRTTHTSFRARGKTAGENQ